MKSIRRHGMTLSGRIILFLLIFMIALLSEIVLWHYQSVGILAPTQARMEAIQNISRFLSGSEVCMDVLEEYRWDFGDAGALIQATEEYQRRAREQLREIHAEPGQASEEYILLANAAETDFEYLSLFLDEISSLLQLGDSGEASRIYYRSAQPCGGYLLQYARELLEQAILDNQDAFNTLSVTGQRLRLLQYASLTLSVVATALLVVSLMFLLRSVVQLSRASRQISQGELDIPDVDDSRNDEIGHLARTFNEMKHSMKQQMQLLQEKSEMEHVIYEREMESLELRSLIEAGKLQLLRSQIHPHFLFNTLNVISYNARQEGAEKTGMLIASLGRLFRYSLGSNAAQVPLIKEKQIVDDFYSLYHARFGDRLRLVWNIDPGIDLSETMIPSFLIEPLVENAIQHGLAPKEDGGCVEIDVCAEDGLLKISVTDNGLGMSSEALETLHTQLQSGSPTGEHIGLYNVAARLALSAGSRGLELRSAPGEGTCAVMRLPLVILQEEESEDE